MTSPTRARPGRQSPLRRLHRQGKVEKRLPEILAMITTIGRAKQSDRGWVGQAASYANIL